MLYTQFTIDLNNALDALVMEGALPAGVSRENITVESPRDPAHGDLSTNAAMVLAKPAGTSPKTLAALLIPKLNKLSMVESARVAGPGFINLTLTDETWRVELTEIHRLGADYGRSTFGGGKRVNIEYVSANPTGPMHMGHCRGAVVGDALASLLEYVGYKVDREYYVNDAGGQVDVLARSVHLRYLEALGEDIGAIPEGLYPGDYLLPVGQALAKLRGKAFVDKPEADWLISFREAAVAAMLDIIRADLAQLGISHDVFASELKVQANKLPEAAEATLRARDLVYDGVLDAPKGQADDAWEPVTLPLFRSTQFGDDQDRAIRKSNGAWTYFGADMAYHYQKAQSADMLIDIWGADHAGTVKRIKAAVAALTDGKTPFDVKIIQMVRLLRNGEPVKMSKRSGNFVTLAEVVEEVGKDVVRFTMLMRKPDAQMDFDFAKVVEASKENPVFYVQYASARIHSLARKAIDLGMDVNGAPNPALLETEDLALVKFCAQFPRIVSLAATHHEPHRIALYLYDLAAAFHAHWNSGNDFPEKRVLVVNNAALTTARLFMTAAIGQVITNGLNILGVVAATEM